MYVLLTWLAITAATEQSTRPASVWAWHGGHVAEGSVP